MTTVVVSQSNYLPWKGYFDLVSRADKLILLDDVQFTRRDWRTRNRIKTPTGVQWLSVPVSIPNGRLSSISEVATSGTAWIDEHLRAISLNYRRAPFFEEVFTTIEAAIRSAPAGLSELNEGLLRTLLEYMDIRLEVSASRGPMRLMDPSARIAALVAGADGTTYLSGPAAMAYLDVDAFKERGISVEFMAYPLYPEYEQVWPPFRHDVSIVDVLFHLGKGWRTALGGRER